MKKLFSESRLVFQHGVEAPGTNSEAAPKSAEVFKDDLVKLTKLVLETGPNADNKELKTKAQEFMDKHEANPPGRISEIKNKVQSSTDPKINLNQVDVIADKIDNAIQALAHLKS